MIMIIVFDEKTLIEEDLQVNEYLNFQFPLYTSFFSCTIILQFFQKTNFNF
jgi:hypothetical protein